MTAFYFRPLEELDLKLLHRWLNLEHVKQWWGQQELSDQAIVEKYLPRIRGEEPVAGYVISSGETPIGYIQTYRLEDYPDYKPYLPNPNNASGVDLYIGEPNYLHRGLGSVILRQFLQEVVFGTMQAERCVIDPDPVNKIAIRAYEKAGFKYLQTVQFSADKEPAYLMQIEKAELL